MEAYKIMSLWVGTEKVTKKSAGESFRKGLSTKRSYRPYGIAIISREIADTNINPAYQNIQLPVNRT